MKEAVRETVFADLALATLREHGCVAKRQNVNGCERILAVSPGGKHLEVELGSRERTGAEQAWATQVEQAGGMVVQAQELIDVTRALAKLSPARYMRGPTVLKGARAKPGLATDEIPGGREVDARKITSGGGKLKQLAARKWLEQGMAPTRVIERLMERFKTTRSYAYHIVCGTRRGMGSV